VSSRLVEPETGRARRYFRLTKQGLVVVRESRLQHARLWHGLDRLLKAHKA
jgi:DNA-binding PadR family transcriptional regulator